MDVSRKLKEAKGSGVAAFTRQGANIKRKQLPAKNIEGLMKKDLDSDTTIVVIYKPSVYPSKLFLSNLKTLLEDIKECSSERIVMGDFNEKLMYFPTPVKSLMEQYGFHQLVTFPTTENRTLIDHVYSTIPPSDIQISLVPTYYSYHEAISIQIKKSLKS